MRMSSTFVVVPYWLLFISLMFSFGGGGGGGSSVGLFYCLILSGIGYDSKKVLLSSISCQKVSSLLTI
jgi:hypothetical protein